MIFSAEEEKTKMLFAPLSKRSGKRKGNLCQEFFPGPQRQSSEMATSGRVSIC